MEFFFKGEKVAKAVGRVAELARGEAAGQDAQAGASNAAAAISAPESGEQDEGEAGNSSSDDDVEVVATATLEQALQVGDSMRAPSPAGVSVRGHRAAPLKECSLRSYCAA